MNFIQQLTTTPASQVQWVRSLVKKPWIQTGSEVLDCIIRVFQMFCDYKNVKLLFVIVNSQPTPEMYQKAYNLYNGKLKTSCFW